MTGHRASGASGKESEAIDGDRDDGGDDEGVRGLVNEAYINRMLEDEYELMNDDSSDYI